jgi:hypothetical protein
VQVTRALLVLVVCAGCAAPVITRSDGDLAVAGGNDLPEPDDLRAPNDLGGPPDLTPPSDLAGLGPEVYSSPAPAPALYNSSYPIPFQVTLATADPTATIYYTQDGTTPTLSSTHAVTPITGISISAAATLRYFAVNANGSGPAKVDLYNVDSAQQTKAGYLATATTLDGKSPVVFATPGQALSAVTNYMMWVQSTCPMCAAQLVWGVDTTDQGCLYDGSPGVYPGASASAKSFTVTAPTAPGVHEVKLAHIEDTNCAMAMAAGALATRPNTVRIGVIVVQ